MTSPDAGTGWGQSVKDRHTSADPSFSLEEPLGHTLGMGNEGTLGLNPDGLEAGHTLGPSSQLRVDVNPRGPALAHARQAIRDLEPTERGAAALEELPVETAEIAKA